MGGNAGEQKDGIIGWIDYRLPIFTMLQHSAVEYPTPRNLNYWWNFGSIAGICLVLQILTGIVLVMHYVPHTSMAFDSVEHIMRDVNYGWLIRYMHAVGASMFFGVVYIHIFRGLYYGSYKAPREILWWLGIVILLLMMATAFMGYVLPWGQMSFWGATVITNLFSAFPVVGESIVTWLWGGFSVDNPTLNRFFSLHYLMPFLLVGVVFMHLWALHTHGSNNPLGIDVKSDKDTIPFHPYYTVKDFLGFSIFFMIFAWFVFFAPNYLGHADNYIPADPLVTPPHIVPEWYFLPFYAILRAVPDKLGGVLAMFASIMVLFVLPWLDTQKVRSARFRPHFRPFFWLFVINAVALGWLGQMPAEGWYVWASRACTLYYFGYFFILWQVLPRFEKTLPLPESIASPVLRKACIALAIGVLSFGAVSDAQAAGDVEHPKQQAWQFDGMTGTVDRQSAQRGLQVYREVCASCHSLKRIAFRNLTQLGFSEDEVKAMAAEYDVTDGPNDEGDMFERKAAPFDKFPGPYANTQQARASNGGAYPPDLSLIIKARPDGANYLHSLLTGYGDAPEDFEVGEGLNYNPYFAGSQIAMAAPLSDGQVEYQDGTDASVDQMAKDVANFLQWTAEPEMEMRKKMGIRVLIFLAIMSFFFYLAKKRIWADVYKNK